jgi:hypothetical protein
MISALALALMLSGGTPQGLAPAPNPGLIRVFVHTEETGQASELADRRQSVRDLAAALAKSKKTLAVVDAADKADVVAEILDRGVTVPKVVIGLSPRPGDPSSIAGMGTPVRIVVLRIKLTSGDVSPIFTNKNKPAESRGGWKSAADDIGNQIEKWIAQRRAEILKRRD